MGSCRQCDVSSSWDSPVGPAARAVNARRPRGQRAHPRGSSSSGGESTRRRCKRSAVLKEVGRQSSSWHRLVRGFLRTGGPEVPSAVSAGGDFEAGPTGTVTLRDGDPGELLEFGVGDEGVAACSDPDDTVDALPIHVLVGPDRWSLIPPTTLSA